MKNLLIRTNAFVLLSLAVLISCKDKDEHKPPKLEFKTGSTYVSSDRTLKKDTTIVVGITATKTEDDFKTFNVGYAYDNGSSLTTFSNESISGSDKKGFSRDVSIHIRNQSGQETWTFTAVDVDGNVSKISLNFNVP